MKKKIALILAAAMLVSTVGVTSACSVNANAAEKSKTTETKKSSESQSDSDVPSIPAHIKDGVAVVSVFAGAASTEPEKPDATEGTKPEVPEEAGDDLNNRLFDTVLIFYDDNTFDQYTEGKTGFEHFSTGKYSFKDNGDFILDEKKDDGTLVIEHTGKKKMEDTMISDYSAKNEYKLDDFSLTQIYGPEDNEEVEAILGDTNRLLYKDKDDVVYHLDGLWIFFADGCFKQFAYLDGDVVPFANGTYEFDKNGDFHNAPSDKDGGKITLTWEESIGEFPDKKQTLDLKSWGLTSMFEIKDENMELPGQTAGGWQDAEDKTVTKEMKAGFEKAVKGTKYEGWVPKELVATQVVAGTNYKFLCENGKTLMVYQDLQDNWSVLNDDYSVVEKSSDGQNPVMNFIGDYQCDRAHATVECSGDADAKIIIEWGGSAEELARWDIVGSLDTDTLTIKYSDATKSIVTYDDKGEVKSQETEYKDGTGTITFNDDGTFTWHEDQSETGTDMVFEWVPVNAE